MVLLGEMDGVDDLPSWVKVAAIVLTVILVPAASTVLTFWLQARSKLAELRARENEADDKRSAGRRAEDRREDERQGKFWMGVYNRHLAETTARLAKLETELEECRTEHVEAREMTARLEERLGAEAERTKILMGQLDQMREVFRRSGLDPGSKLHDVLRDDRSPDGGSK